MVLLLVDGDCGFCMRAGAWLKSRTDGIEIARLQQVDVTQYGLEPSAVAKRLHAISPDSVRVGSAAIAEALRHGSLRLRVAAAILEAPVLRWFAHGVYAMVARFRHRLPGGTAECRLPTEGAEGTQTSRP